MTANYLMFSASILYFICYLPELYANYKNKNVNAYNLPEKIIMLIATTLAFSYAVINDNVELITNYGPLMFLDVISLTVRLYYTYYNHYSQLENIKTDSNSVVTVVNE
jgi:uncharacterized protein with PQ loop repeat